MKRRLSSPILLSLLAVLFALTARFIEAQTLPPSERVTINMGQTPWKYLFGDPANAQSPTFNDSSWITVGVPYSADQLDTFLNTESGGGDGDLNGPVSWYRNYFTLSSQYASRKVLIEFEGAHTGVQVYINGTLLPGISAVTADAQATHVVGFVPFIVDVTPYVKFDGTNNVLAVRAAKNAAFFEAPGFSQGFRFGQSDSGLFRPVDMFITDKVHIPQNVYSNLGTWGTYVETLSASSSSALIDIKTNVLNEGTTSQQVTLTTQIVDASGNVVASGQSSQTVAPNAGPGLNPQLFDQQLTVNNPTLWYPNNSVYGTPYMYKVFHIVSINGSVIDSVQSPLGIRTITWDQNLPYINGHPMNLWGASGRYDYPALGTAVPEEQKWRDLQQLAAMGGNLWRPGHSTESEEFVNAADAYGIMIVQPSGEGEGAFSAHCDTPPCDIQTLKSELHRDMIVRDRNHPSILAWEADNGPIDTDFAQQLKAISEQWDPTNTRVQADRTPNPANGDILGCTLEGCEVLVKQTYPSNPAWGAEYWGNGTARQAFDYELAFAAPFLDNWRQGRQAGAFGMAQWYFADSPGETSTYVEGSAEPDNRSLGASMVDMNRFPKMLYYIYEAAWTPYSLKPVVHLAHHWNRSGAITVNAFSNCPSVRLLINGVAQGSDQIPNPWTSDSSSNLTQTTTLMPFQVHWNVTWQSGTVTAECLDSYGNVQATDAKTTAGPEDHIELDVVPDVVKPDGTSFAITADGSDTMFIVAKVVDANGIVVPTATDNVTFSVSGPGTYVGGSEQYVQTGSDAYSTANSSLNYHAPGDPELQVEGGMTKVAIRSQFTTGTVTLTATAPGLKTGTASYTVQPIPSTAPTAEAPAIIAEPVSTAVTVGQPATFTVTATGASPLTFQWRQNGANISGATSSSYTTPATTTSQSGTTYSVVVTNSLGSATSSSAILTVAAAAAPAITVQPVSQLDYVGQTANFSVAATGSPTLTYQWKKNGVAIAGATGSSYTTSILAASDNGEIYTVTVTNPVSSITSSNATLTVDAASAPTITTQPASVSVAANQPAIFSVVVAGTTPITYQWQNNGTNIEGATAASYTIPQAQTSNVGSYTVIITNIAGTVTSEAATLTIAPPGTNLALNQPATASSYQDPVGMPASASFDGNLTTRWGSAQGVDPSWIEVDLGSVQPFNTVVLYWEAAYASVYQIQYSTDNSTWQTAYTNNAGVGGTETLNFPTVKGRYVRMYGTTRATPYGYSLYEFQIYNVAQCGGSAERYTVLSTTQVLDNLSQLTWQRAEYTYTTPGSQLTEPLAAQYCSSQNMRLPTQAEALAISGNSDASCAFPQSWSTWTSTQYPSNNTYNYIVSSTGASTFAVASNYPGAVLCAAGTATTPPSITTQPASQTVTTGQTATFSVIASGTGPLTYQWYKNSAAVTGATANTYTTPAAQSSDNGALFSVVVTGPTGETATSTAATLTVTGGGGTSGTDIVAINSGGAATGAFAADEDFTNGGTDTSTNTITTAGVANAAPQAVYQSERAGVFTYTIPGLTANASYGVRLHFAEFYWTKAGQRIFNVAINGTTVLANFDIVAAAGGPDIAVVEPFSVTANGSGQIVISFTAGSADQPKVSGIEILSTLAPPTAPSGLTATAASSSQINLAWTASTTTGVTYSVFRSTTSGFTPSSSNQVASGISATTYSSTGLTASTQYYYVVEAVNTAGSSSPTAQATATTQAAIPTAPTSLTATAASSSQINLAWTASITTGVTYSVFRSTTTGFAPSVSNQVTTGISATNYADTGLNASTPYFYVVEAVNSAGSSPATAQVTATTQAAATGADVIAIDSGGAATGSFAADEDYSGGGSAATGNTITTTGVANAAPEVVYQSERAGVFTYTLPGLTSGASYIVRLHFAEFYWTTTGQRIFNVAINGTTVLANFDIIAAAGAANKALVEQFTATANSSGQIVISFTAGSADQPKVSGIELLTSGGATNAPVITTQPAAVTATIGTTGNFSVTASGSGLSYQWKKNGTAISGATAATYTTLGTTASDNSAAFSVVVSNSAGSSTSSNATLTVNANPTYTVVSGYVMTDLNNNTRGAWADNQVYIEVIGNNPSTGALSWVNYNGTVTAASVADNTSSTAITAANGQTYPNYAFTLAQSHSLKLPPISSGRIFVSFGHPLYMTVVAGSNGSLGYAGPNPLNNTDPNINTNYDWYEFTYGTGGIYINTTQVDQFGLPLLLDVWCSSETFHMQTGINEPVAQIDQEYIAQTPAVFHTPAPTTLRIFSPANSTFNTGEANASYFASYIASVWSFYATTPLTVQLDSGTREFTGNTSGTNFVFTEVNLNNGAYVGGTYTLVEPTTQDILFCSGAFAESGYNSVESALGAQFCAAFNRAVMTSYSEWTVPADFYQTAPANYYAQFWHNHSVGGLAYGFAYDDVNNQSSTVTTGNPEHMAFGIGW